MGEPVDYAIRNDQGLYFSFNMGWIPFSDLNDRDFHTYFETKVTRLPIGGEWVKVK